MCLCFFKSEIVEEDYSEELYILVFVVYLR